MDFKTKRTQPAGDIKRDTGIAANLDFKTWFGKSKVVDSKGKPLVVYHGTRRPFDTFSPGKPRGAPGNPAGTYFTADRRVAEEYAQDVDGAWDEKSRIVAAYIKIENDSDGAIIESAYRGREYVVYEPRNIKVTEMSTDNHGTKTD